MKKMHLKHLLLFPFFRMSWTILPVLWLAVLLFSCSQAEQQDGDGQISTEIVNNPVTASGVKTDKAIPEIKFEEEVHNFKKVIQGEKVSYSFKFKNTGDADLIISGVSASCGCTVPSWPKKLIAPGDEGTINVVFDSDGKKGRQNKAITVVTNSIPNTRVLHIVGEVMIPQGK